MDSQQDIAPISQVMLPDILLQLTSVKSTIYSIRPATHIRQVPIDRSFRETWSVDSLHEGHKVWSSNGQERSIHGEVVGVHIPSCIGCMKCVTACPVHVFVSWTSVDNADVVDPIRDTECILCMACELVCPTEAIHIQRKPGSQDTLDSLLRSV